MQRRSLQNTGRQILPKNSLALNHQQNVGLIEPTQMVQKETEVSLFVSFKFKQKILLYFQSARYHGEQSRGFRGDNVKNQNNLQKHQRLLLQITLTETSNSFTSKNNSNKKQKTNKQNIFILFVN